MTNSTLKYFLFTGLLLFGFFVSAYSQSKPAVKKDTASGSTIQPTKPLTEKQVRDSLQQVIINLSFSIDSLNKLLATEKLSTADLRDQVISLDDYRKKLEGTISSFKGENLKLNQSNRILLVQVWFKPVITKV